MTLVPHPANIESVSALRDSGMSKVAVGDFSLAKGVEPSLDRSVGVRGRAVQSPNDKSFALYLRESLITDLRAADKLDSAAPRVISGELTENKLNAAGISQASSTVAARFRVTESGRSLFEKELRVETSWESAFTGMLAIPAAIDHYTEQYTRLLAQLYKDAEFRKACSVSAGESSR